MKNTIRWITRTAVFIALLIVLQMATAPLGNILITGSLVNLLLIISVMTCGLASGLSVAVISPVMAKLLGIGPLWSLIPFIAAGNIALVLLWHFIGNRQIGRKYTSAIIALIFAAAAKFLVLYIGIVRITIPVFLSLPRTAGIGAFKYVFYSAAYHRFDWRYIGHYSAANAQKSDRREAGIAWTLFLRISFTA